MSAALGKPPAVQRNEVANVVGYQHPASLVRGFQLPVVIDSGESQLIGGFGIYPVRWECLSQSAGLAILVQMDPDSAHRRGAMRQTRLRFGTPERSSGLRVQFRV